MQKEETVASDDPCSGLYPRVGELWDCAGEMAIVCGNRISEKGRIWLMAWNSGMSGRFRLPQMKLRDDRLSISMEAMVARLSEWARAGNAEAMWWLAWAHEGVNHPKSVWYYVAALRADPQAYRWAHERIVSDAYSATMCKDAPRPDLAFLQEIPEIQDAKILRDWASAVKMAENAVHHPAVKGEGALSGELVLCENCQNACEGEKSEVLVMGCFIPDGDLN